MKYTIFFVLTILSFHFSKGQSCNSCALLKSILKCKNVDDFFFLEKHKDDLIIIDTANKLNNCNIDHIFNRKILFVSGNNELSKYGNAFISNNNIIFFSLTQFKSSKFQVTIWQPHNNGQMILNAEKTNKSFRLKIVSRGAF